MTTLCSGWNPSRYGMICRIWAGPLIRSVGRPSDELDREKSGSSAAGIGRLMADRAPLTEPRWAAPVRTCGPPALLTSWGKRARRTASRLAVGARRRMLGGWQRTHQRPRAVEARPYGRRIVLSVIGVGAIGVAARRAAAERHRRRALAGASRRPNRPGRPGTRRGRLALLLGHRQAARPVHWPPTASCRRTGRPHDDTDLGRHRRSATDQVDARLPVRHGLAGRRRRVAGRPAA